MSDGNDSANGEVLTKRLLDQIVCGSVDGSCGLVENQHLASLEQNSTEAHKLPLSHTPILSILGNWKTRKFVISD